MEPEANEYRVVREVEGSTHLLVQRMDGGPLLNVQDLANLGTEEATKALAFLKEAIEKTTKGQRSAESYPLAEPLEVEVAQATIVPPVVRPPEL